MRRFHEGPEPDMLTPQNQYPRDNGTDESEIDQILADSFPASDAPPWTLGVSAIRVSS